MLDTIVKVDDAAIRAELREMAARCYHDSGEDFEEAVSLMVAELHESGDLLHHLLGEIVSRAVQAVITQQVMATRRKARKAPAERVVVDASGRVKAGAMAEIRAARALQIWDFPLARSIGKKLGDATYEDIDEQVKIDEQNVDHAEAKLTWIRSVRRAAAKSKGTGQPARDVVDEATIVRLTDEA